MLCCDLSQIYPVFLRKDNYFKPLPVGKLAEILALDKTPKEQQDLGDDVVEVTEAAHIVALEKGVYEVSVMGKVVETYIN